MEELARAVKRTYFAWEPFSTVEEGLREFLERQEEEECLTLQAKLVRELLDGSRRFPVHPDCGRRFLRRLAVTLERRDGLEVSEELYKASLAADDPQGRQRFFYKSYFIGDDDDGDSACCVSLAESRELVSVGGATGLRTWEAATAFLAWARSS